MLIHSDGFDSHLTGAATLSDGDTSWTGQSGVTITATNGKFGGKSLRRAAATAGYAAFTNSGTQRGLAGYFLVGTFGGAAETALFSTGAAANVVTVDNVGTVRVYDGSSTLRITKTLGITAGVYAWVEVDFLSGSIVLLINGIPVGSFTGAYTTVSSSLRVLGNAPANTPITDVDDFISWDDSGSYFNTFGLSPRRIQLLRPTADGTTIQWTPTSGTNWQAVDDTDWSGGVGVTATAAGFTDLYALSDLAVNPATINAVTVRTRAVNTGDNPAQLSHVIRGTDSAETTSALQAVPSVTPAVLKSVFYRDPAGAPWTASTVNSLQAGQTSAN